MPTRFPRTRAQSSSTATVSHRAFLSSKPTAATIAPGDLRIYLDGAEVGHVAVRPVPLEKMRLHIGAIGHDAQYYGLLDELRLFDRVLPPEEIANLHQRELSKLENQTR